MRILDEKGRIFGVINLIDLLVILFILMLVPMFYYGYHIFKGKHDIGKVDSGSVITEKEMSVQICLKVTDVRPQTGMLIAVGDKEIDGKGNTLCEVLSVTQASKSDYISESDLINIDSDSKNIFLVVQLWAGVSGDRLFYKGNLLKMDLPVQLHTSKYAITGYVVSFKNEERYLDFSAHLADLDAESIKKVSVGDKEIDNANNITAEISEIGVPIHETFMTSQGLLGTDKSNFVVPIKIRLKCYLKDNLIFFKGIKVTVLSCIKFRPNNNKYIATIKFIQ